VPSEERRVKGEQRREKSDERVKERPMRKALHRCTSPHVHSRALERDTEGLLQGVGRAGWDARHRGALTSLAPLPNALKQKAMEMMAMIQSYFARTAMLVEWMHRKYQKERG
jgi:hypothetical protein